jgi:hypothetical protein
MRPGSRFTLVILAGVIGAAPAPALAQGRRAVCRPPADWGPLPTRDDVERRPAFAITRVGAGGAERDTAAVRRSIVAPQYGYYRDPARGCLPVLVVQRTPHALGYFTIDRERSGAAPDTAFSLLGSVRPRP